MSLEDARAFVLKHRTDQDGVDCPCCGRKCKEYKRSINSEMSRKLINLFHMNDDEFHHIRDLNVNHSGGGDFAKLRFWGFIVEGNNDDPKKKNSGKWKITYQGRLFVHGMIPARKYCHIYDNHLLGFTGDMITIEDALTEEFDYEALMRDTGVKT